MGQSAGYGRPRHGAVGKCASEAATSAAAALADWRPLRSMLSRPPSTPPHGLVDPSEGSAGRSPSVMPTHAAKRGSDALSRGCCRQYLSGHCRGKNCFWAYTLFQKGFAHFKTTSNAVVQHDARLFRSMNCTHVAQEEEVANQSSSGPLEEHRSMAAPCPGQTALAQLWGRLVTCACALAKRVALLRHFVVVSGTAARSACYSRPQRPHPIVDPPPLFRRHLPTLAFPSVQTSLTRHLCGDCAPRPLYSPPLWACSRRRRHRRHRRAHRGRRHPAWKVRDRCLLRALQRLVTGW